MPDYVCVLLFNRPCGTNNKSAVQERSGAKLNWCRFPALGLAEAMSLVANQTVEMSWCTN